MRLIGWPDWSLIFPVGMNRLSDIIEKILRHLDLWDLRNHYPPPQQRSYIPDLLGYVVQKADIINTFE